MQDLSKLSNCPVCNTSWDAGNIFDVLVKQDWWKLKMTEGELLQYIKNVYSPPYKFSRLIGIEDPKLRDGVSFWKCPDCKTVWSRSSGEIIPENKM